MSLAVLKPPGEWGAKGADIVCGEGQPLGVALSSGRPLLRFHDHAHGTTCGRCPAASWDARRLDGKPGFTLTLQAREQHIRRSKATSNICTNQGLLVTAATIYMSLVGPQGLAKVASTCIQRTAELVAALAGVPGVRVAFNGPRFHEAVLLLEPAGSRSAPRRSRRGASWGGVDISRDYPSLGNPLLVCATETRTPGTSPPMPRARGRDAERGRGLRNTTCANS